MESLKNYITKSNTPKIYGVFGVKTPDTIALEDSMRNFINDSKRIYRGSNKKDCEDFLKNFKKHCLKNKWSETRLNGCLKKYELMTPSQISSFFYKLEERYDELSDDWKLDNVLAAQSKLKKEAMEFKGKLTYGYFGEYDEVIDELDDEDIWYIYLRGDASDTDNIIKFKKPEYSNEYERSYMEHICRYIWAMETNNSYYKGNTCSKGWYDKNLK